MFLARLSVSIQFNAKMDEKQLNELVKINSKEYSHSEEDNI